MEKIHENILITGVPGSGKTTIHNIFANLADKCNVLDTDAYGEWVYDTVSKKNIWKICVFDIKNKLNCFEDKPTIIVGISENIGQLIEEIHFSTVYVIDHNTDKIAERLNLRFDKLDNIGQQFLRTIYGVKYHDRDSINSAFANSLKEISRYKHKGRMFKIPIMEIISEIALFLNSSK